MITHEYSRKLKIFMKDKHPCKDCISYPICQNRDVVSLIKCCKSLRISLTKPAASDEGLSVVLITTQMEKDITRYYVYNHRAYLGAFFGFEIEN